MSDRESSYSQSPLATLNVAYSMNQPRISPSSPSVLAPRRPSRASYRPSLSPPPDIALPVPPSFATASTNAFGHSQQQPLRISNQSARGYTSQHPYSAQSLASTPDIDQDYANGFPLHPDRNQRAFYRSQAHRSPLQQPTTPSTNSQAQNHNFPSRPQNSSSSDSLQQTDSDLAYASASPARDRTASVSPGSYFAAYPPAPAQTSRDRSDSESSAISGGSSSHTASANALAPSHNQSSTPPPLTQPPAHRAHPRSSNPAQSSSRHVGASHSHRTRPSSRRALTAALELAKSAVLLDQTNDDPHGAVQAYANTVRLLGEVMERVMRGEDPPSSSTTATNSSDAPVEDGRRRGRRRSGVVAKEEEVRRLKAIHDTYADRLTILCLIYSIPHPSPSDRPVAGPSSSTPQITSGPEGVSSSVSPPQQIGSTVSFSESEQDTDQFPDAPEDIHPDDYASKEHEDAATIRRGHPSNGTENELESDSDWERSSLSRDGPVNRQRETGTSFSAYRHQQHQQNQYPQHVLHGQGVPAYVEDSYNVDTPRRLHSSWSTATPVPRNHPQDAPASVPASISLSAFRNSIVPPPRPPPSGPLPTRPRLANGAIIPPQLLNQPLPPLPPVPKSPSDMPPSSSQYTPTPVQPQFQTLTRQSSASSVSGLSGASSNASGSSAASNNLVVGQPANLVVLQPNSLPPPTTAALNAQPPNATLSPPGPPSRPRGNSNAHGRNLSNTERLVVVNEEKEEDEGTIRNSAAALSTRVTSTTPPQEQKYRSRSGSMVSLKDRDRAKAQVLGNTGQSPLPPLPGVQRQPSTEDLGIPSPIPSPNTATFGAKATPRPRGSSVGSSATHASDDYITNGSYPNTITVANVLPYTAGGAPGPGSAPIIVPGAAGNSGLEGAIKLNPNTKEGTISQRRSTAASAVGMSTGGPNQSGHGKLTSAILPAATATSLGLTGRHRAASNPGKRPAGIGSISMGETTTRPPMPPPPMSAGPRRQFPTPSAARYHPSFGMASPNGSANASSTSLVPLMNGAPIAGVPASAPPLTPPALAILRPYHLMSLLRRSMTDRSGGFITPRLHVPHEVWTQGSLKLTNSAEKTKVIDVLVAALEELANASVDFCGSSSGIVSSVGGGERKQGERWAGKLEDFDRAFNQVGMSFGKKLGVGEGFVVKKSVGVAAWSNKFFDKIVAAAGKPYDSPMAYASLLTKLFGLVQILDEHSRASQISPQPPAYASLPQDVRNRIDTSLKSISELFSKVVLTFVFRDLSLMLDKYHKTCDRWIQSNPGTPA